MSDATTGTATARRASRGTRASGATRNLPVAEVPNSAASRPGRCLIGDGYFPTARLTFTAIEAERGARGLLQSDLCAAAGVYPSTYRRRLAKPDPNKGHRRTVLKLNSALARLTGGRADG